MNVSDNCHTNEIHGLVTWAAMLARNIWGGGKQGCVVVEFWDTSMS